MPNADPAQAASEAAAAVRTFNHLTYKIGWAPNPGDVSDVANALQWLADRLPQALTQLYAELDRLDQAGVIRMDDGTDPVEQAGRALVGVERARALAQQLGSALGAVAGPLSHMGTK